MKGEETSKMLADAEEQLVTVATYGSPYEAGLAKSELEAYDIPVYVVDEYTIGMNNLYSNAPGGVKVTVPASFAEDARRILRFELLPQEEALQQDLEHSSTHNDLAKSFAWMYVALGISGLVLLLLRLFE